jgi:hypothetical protein
MLSAHNVIEASATSVKILDYHMSIGGALALTRSGAAIYNKSNKTMYIKFGSEASKSAFTVPLLSGSYWEVPESFKGQVFAVWDNGCDGSAQVTEW